MSEQDPRPIEARLEAAFDRFNRAAIAGMEPTPVLFIEALEAEGLHLTLTLPEPLEVTDAQTPGTEEPAARGRPIVSCPIGSAPCSRGEVAAASRALRSVRAIAEGGRPGSIPAHPWDRVGAA